MDDADNKNTEDKNENKSKNENENENENESNNEFNNNNNINKNSDQNDFLNNVSEELQAEMNLLKYYSGTGKMIGAFYSGLLEEVNMDMAIEFTRIFIENYVNNLFRGQRG